MDTPGYHDHKADYLKRLRRIEGQVRGLQRMVDEDVYCIDILTQVSAVKSALQSVSVGPGRGPPGPLRPGRRRGGRRRRRRRPGQGRGEGRRGQRRHHPAAEELTPEHANVANVAPEAPTGPSSHIRMFVAGRPMTQPQNPDQAPDPGPAEHTLRRPPGRRDDLRVLRGPGGEEAQRPRGRRGQRQPRYRLGSRPFRSCAGRRGHVGRDRREHRLQRLPALRPTSDPAADEATYARGLLRRLLLAAPLTLVVLVLAMAPGVARLPWLQLALALPVVLYAGWPFHRAAAVNARHLASTMDTLVSLGTLVALVWSVVQLLEGSMHLYFEVATTVTTFLLLGRYLEARAKSRAGSRPARAARARREARGRARGRPRARGRRRRPAAGDADAGATRRPGADRRPRGRGRQRRRRVDGHRREPARGQVAGRRGRRRHPERRRPPGRRGHPDRTRHPARPDPAVGRRRPGRQGPGPAPRRPHLGLLRAGGARDRGRHLPRLGAHRARHQRRDDRRRQRAGDRLPVRPRPGHTDRPARRHRPRRPARHRDPRRRGARVLARDHHRGARQDRHPDHRRDGGPPDRG